MKVPDEMSGEQIRSAMVRGITDYDEVSHAERVHVLAFAYQQIGVDPTTDPKDVVFTKMPPAAVHALAADTFQHTLNAVAEVFSKIEKAHNAQDRDKLAQAMHEVAEDVIDPHGHLRCLHSLSRCAAIALAAVNDKLKDTTVKPMPHIGQYN